VDHRCADRRLIGEYGPRVAVELARLLRPRGRVPRNVVGQSGTVRTLASIQNDGLAPRRASPFVTCYEAKFPKRKVP